MSTPEALLRWAAALVPGEQRDRYAQEWAAEIAELPERDRWGYAARVLLSAPRLALAVRPSATRRLRVSMAVLVVVVVLAASVGVIAARRDGLMRAPLEVVAAAGPAQQITWAYTLPGAQPNPNQIVATDDALVVVGTEFVVGVDPASGAERWRRPWAELGPHLASVPGGNGDRLGAVQAIAGTSLMGTGVLRADPFPVDGEVAGALFDARTGEVVTRGRDLAPQPGMETAAVADGVVAIEAQADGSCGLARVAASDLNGRQRWAASMLLPAPIKPGHLVADGLLFLGGGGEEWGVPSRAVVNAATGAVVGHQQCVPGYLQGFSPVAGGRILATETETDGEDQVGRARMLSAAGDELWVRTVNAWAVDGQVFDVRVDRWGSDGRATWRRLDPDTGRSAWPNAVKGGRLRVFGDVAVVTSADYRAGDQGSTEMALVDLATGAVRSRREVPFAVEEVATDGQRLYLWENVHDSDRIPEPLRLIAVDLATGGLAWQTTFNRGTKLRVVGGHLVLSDRLTGAVYGLGGL